MTHQRALLPVIERIAEAITSRELCDLLDAHGVPAAPVQTIEQVVKDAQTEALGIIQQGPDGAIPTVGLPWRFDGLRPDYVAASPRLSQHTVDWLPTAALVWS